MEARGGGPVAAVLDSLNRRALVLGKAIRHRGHWLDVQANGKLKLVLIRLIEQYKALGDCGVM